MSLSTRLIEGTKPEADTLLSLQQKTGIPPGTSINLMVFESSFKGKKVYCCWSGGVIEDGEPKLTLVGNAALEALVDLPLGKRVSGSPMRPQSSPTSSDASQPPQLRVRPAPRRAIRFGTGCICQSLLAKKNAKRRSSFGAVHVFQADFALRTRRSVRDEFAKPGDPSYSSFTHPRVRPSKKLCHIGESWAESERQLLSLALQELSRRSHRTTAEQTAMRSSLIPARRRRQL